MELTEASRRLGQAMTAVPDPQTSEGGVMTQLSDHQIFFEHSATRSAEEQGRLHTDELPWLYFGITRPVGTPTDLVTDELKSDLKKSGYFVSEIKISSLIDQVFNEIFPDEGPARPSPSSATRTYDRYVRLMKSGDMLRHQFGASFAAQLAIREISERRFSDIETARLGASGSIPFRGVAYIIGSLLHPSEVELLRTTYKQRFFLIGVNAPIADRLAKLRDDFSGEPTSVKKPEEKAASLVQMDSGLRPTIKQIRSENRLNVDKTFHHADVFCTVDVRTDEPGAGPDSDRDKFAKLTISRFTGQLFGYPFGTPTTHEYAMATAYQAAKSSVALGRSVGASVVDNKGAVLASGWNEVARPLGGPYRDGDKPDYRDHKLGFDPSDGLRLEAVQGFLDILFDPESWISELKSEVKEKASTDWLELFNDGVNKLGKIPHEIVESIPMIEEFSGSRVLNLIEFGRSVHAEMAAITDAARRGVKLESSSLYVTTFPCHECARNILSTGITKVQYVEPYGKSLAGRLYANEIRIFGETLGMDKSDIDVKIDFEPFCGISPKRFDELFSYVNRKVGLSDNASSSAGEAKQWLRGNSELRRPFVGYSTSESEGSVLPEIEDAMLAIERHYAEVVSSKISEAKRDFSKRGESSH